jgi:diguanylate cyclase (GGDEF)-like protein/PAS domain S-box-containing protein
MEEERTKEQLIDELKQLQQKYSALEKTDAEYKKTSEELQISIFKISEAVHSAQSLGELFRSIHKIINDLMTAKNFYIALYDADTETISFPYYKDEYDETPTPRKLGRGLTEYILRTGKSLFATSEKIKELAETGEIEIIGTLSVEWLGVPLNIKERIIGVLTVQNYAKGVRYSDRDMNILKFVSTQVAMAIERKQADQRLQESKERLSAFMDSAPDAFALFDSELRLITINNVGLRMLPPGTKKEDLMGKHMTEIYPDIKEKERYDKYQKVIDDGKPLSIEDIVLRPEFGDIHISVKAFKVGAGLGLVVTDITERKLAEEKLKKLATTDALTDVLNRGFGLLLFGKQLQIAKRENAKLSICYIDVDGLKEVNDTFGHQEGDEVLKIVSNFLKDTLREIDIICRVGGDEFVIVLPQCPIYQAILVWERIAKKLATYNIMNIKPYRISLSRGFAEYDPATEKTVDQLIAAADQEMYKNKAKKKM